MVWSSGLGRCVVTAETQVQTLRSAHYIFLFFNSSLYFYLWTRFCDDKEVNNTVFHCKTFYSPQRVYHFTQKK